MSNRPVYAWSLWELAQAIRNRHVSSREVTQLMLERIAKLDSHYHSYQSVCAARALEQAQAADALLDKGIWKGWLHGVPVGLKDLCYTTFAPTSAGMTIHRDYVPEFNATVVERLEQAGAVSLGKLTMTEGAYIAHHPDITPPVNPWNDAYWTGVSSSGSGVATAAGLCFGAIGSDTGGSIRFPSAHCGLTGLKPTWGRVSRHGVFALGDSLDHVGPMARTAADTAIMLRAMAGYDANDPTSLAARVPDYLAETTRDIRGLRIGIDEAYSFDHVSDEVATALKAAIDVFQRLGARIISVKSPSPEALLTHWISACSAETAQAHADTYPARRAEYGPRLAELIDQGHRLSAMDYFGIQNERRAYSGALATLFTDIDCLLIPTMTTPALSLTALENMLQDPDSFPTLARFTAPFDFSGSPAITLPNGIDPQGLPLSMQLVAAHLDEGRLIRAAHAFQTATDWHTRIPVPAH